MDKIVMIVNLTGTLILMRKTRLKKMMTIQMLMKVSLAMFQMLKVVQLRPIVRKMKDLIGTKWKEEQLNKKIDKK
jgi:hypothetical protein